MSHGGSASVRQDDLFSPEFSPLKATGQTHELQQTGDAILAQLAPFDRDRDKFRVEALFKVKGTAVGGDNVVRIRLWRLWGEAPLERGAILAECEYRQDTMEAEAGRILLAYEVLEWHHSNDYNYGAKVRTINPITGKPESLQPSSIAASSGPLHRIRLFRELLRNLAPGHTILMRMKSEHNQQVIEPEQVVVAQSTTVSPKSSGYGNPPEVGTVWGLVGRVSPEGQVETTSEYKVLSSKESPSKNHWEAQFEKRSNSRRLFSLTDCNETLTKKIGWETRPH